MVNVLAIHWGDWKENYGEHLTWGLFNPIAAERALLKEREEELEELDDPHFDSTYLTNPEVEGNKYYLQASGGEHDEFGATYVNLDLTKGKVLWFDDYGFNFRSLIPVPKGIDWEELLMEFNPPIREDTIMEGTGPNGEHYWKIKWK